MMWHIGAGMRCDDVVAYRVGMRCGDDVVVYRGRDDNVDEVW